MGRAGPRVIASRWEFQVSNGGPTTIGQAVPKMPTGTRSAADRPNFSFEGVEVRWYKRFGRSMNVTVVWPAEKWVRWFERCRQTLRAWEDSEGRPSPRDRVPYPDPIWCRFTGGESARISGTSSSWSGIRTLNAQLTCVACVCIDVSRGEGPRFTGGRLALLPCLGLGCAPRKACASSAWPATSFMIRRSR